MRQRQWFEVRGRTFFAIALPIPRRLLGLSRDVQMSPQTMRPRTQFAVPFGWRASKMPDRCARELMPAWLHYPVMAWRYRWWALAPLELAGFWQMPSDGAYWYEGHFTFRFWESFRKMRRRGTFGGIPETSPLNRWEWLGWKIEKMLARFHAADPWSAAW